VEHELEPVEEETRGQGDKERGQTWQVLVRARERLG
jgi:hypothetical protein